MEGRLPPSFTPHPPTPLSLSLCYYLFLSSPPPFPSSREKAAWWPWSSVIPDRFSRTSHAALNPGTERVQEGPHYSSLHGHSWKHISNDYPPPPLLSFFTSVEEVAALVFTRRGAFVEAAGPELRWARTSIFGIRLSANDRARIFLLVSRGNGHIEFDTMRSRPRQILFYQDQEIYLNYPDRSISSNKFIVIVTG